MPKPIIPRFATDSDPEDGWSEDRLLAYDRFFAGESLEAMGDSRDLLDGWWCGYARAYAAGVKAHCLRLLSANSPWPDDTPADHAWREGFLQAPGL